jgi:hypothetical protein
MTNAKQVGKSPNDPKYESQLLCRLGAGQYPFRGSDQKMEEEENEEELEEAFERRLQISYSDVDE